jgi:hypothetical protein
LRWQAGQVPDLYSGLGDLDRQIQAQLKTGTNENAMKRPAPVAEVPASAVEAA